MNTHFLMTDVRLEHLLTADVILERLLTADLIFEHLLTTDVILGQFDKFLNRMLIFLLQTCASVGGIMVSIAAFQAADPGSIPGRRNIFLPCSGLSAGHPWNTQTQKCYLGGKPFKKISVTGN